MTVFKTKHYVYQVNAKKLFSGEKKFFKNNLVNIEVKVILSINKKNI